MKRISYDKTLTQEVECKFHLDITEDYVAAFNYMVICHQGVYLDGSRYEQLDFDTFYSLLSANEPVQLACKTLSLTLDDTHPLNIELGDFVREWVEEEINTICVDTKLLNIKNIHHNMELIEEPDVAPAAIKTVNEAAEGMEEEPIKRAKILPTIKPRGDF